MLTLDDVKLMLWAECYKKVSNGWWWKKYFKHYRGLKEQEEVWMEKIKDSMNK